MSTVISKPFWKSKLFWLGVGMIGTAVIEYLAGLPVGTTLPQALLGVLTIIFRMVTNQAITR